jgi:hypothetical protein
MVLLLPFDAVAKRFLFATTPRFQIGSKEPAGPYPETNGQLLIWLSLVQLL